MMLVTHGVQGRTMRGQPSRGGTAGAAQPADRMDENDNIKASIVIGRSCSNTIARC